MILNLFRFFLLLFAICIIDESYAIKPTKKTSKVYTAKNTTQRKPKTQSTGSYSKVKSLKSKTKIAKVTKKSKNQKVRIAKQQPISDNIISVIEKEDSNKFEQHKAILKFKADGSPEIENLEFLSSISTKNNILHDAKGNSIKLTFDFELQQRARAILKAYQLPWATIVAMSPKTGKMLAMAGYSSKDPSGQQLLTQATFPAASLFKLVTAAAAVEQKGLLGEDTIYFRGGNYTISQNNYYPDERLDQRQISFSEALGKSINPAFARVAINNLSTSALERYAHTFYFNHTIPFDTPIEVSQFIRPESDYEMARTGAGFGPVTISPIHSAVLTSIIANRGKMMKPYFIDKINSASGSLLYQSTPTPIRVSILNSTAKELLQMMESTIEIGTAKKQFIKLKNPFLINNSIAAKTGTLSGLNPKGVYHWFVVAAPVEDPQIVVSVLVIDPGTARAKSSFIGKELLEFYFRNHDVIGRSVQVRSKERKNASS